MHLSPPSHGSRYLFLIWRLLSTPAAMGLPVESGTNEQLHPACRGLWDYWADRASVCSLFRHSLLSPSSSLSHPPQTLQRPTLSKCLELLCSPVISAFLISKESCCFSVLIFPLFCSTGWWPHCTCVQLSGKAVLGRKKAKELARDKTLGATL